MEAVVSLGRAWGLGPRAQAIILAPESGKESGSRGRSPRLLILHELTVLSEFYQRSRTCVIRGLSSGQGLSRSWELLGSGVSLYPRVCSRLGFSRADGQQEKMDRKRR